MKEVLISIQPKWCELIASGKKTVEVRKTKPKLETPFKCYIYCTKGDSLNYLRKSFFDNVNKFWVDNNAFGANVARANGKVIGEFVCNAIISHCEMANADIAEIQGCIKREKLLEYSNGKELFGWHISDLVIYDKPMELSEFKQVKAIRGYHKREESFAEKLLHSTRLEVNFLKRPPQSWCYVETTEPRQTAD